jgi:hypothetical protein
MGIDQHAVSLEFGGDSRSGLRIVNASSRPMIGKQFEAIPANRHFPFRTESSHEFGDSGAVAAMNFEQQSLKV